MGRDSSRAKHIADSLIDIHRGYGWRAHKEYPFLNRRIDVIAIGPKGCEVIAFEIKVSRADFFAELKNPSKRMRVSNNCSQFYYVTPYGLVLGHEVPDGCGLIYYDSGSDCFSTALPINGKSSLLCRLESQRIDDADDERRLDREREEFDNDLCGTPYMPDELPPWMLPPSPPPSIDIGDDYHSMINTSSQSSYIAEFDFQEVPF